MMSESVNQKMSELVAIDFVDGDEDCNTCINRYCDRTQDQKQMEQCRTCKDGSNHVRDVDQ